MSFHHQPTLSVSVCCAASDLGQQVGLREGVDSVGPSDTGGPRVQQGPHVHIGHAVERDLLLSLRHLNTRTGMDVIC